MKSKELYDKASIECVVSISPYAGLERKVMSKNSRMSVETALCIKRCFENVIITSLYPRSSISIHLNVISNDGGLLSACINATTLALVNAGIPMSDLLVSCTVGYIEKTSLIGMLLSRRGHSIDLNNQETRSGGVILPMAWMPLTNKFPLVTMDSKIPLDVLEVCL